MPILGHKGTRRKNVATGSGKLCTSECSDQWITSERYEEKLKPSELSLKWRLRVESELFWTHVPSLRIAKQKRV